MPATLDSTRIARRSRLEPTEGVALVLVLAFLVLITGLVLAFFTSVTTELSSAKSYADGTTTKQLADSAVQLVMGSISTATSQGPTVSWASQPGMIRTYNNNNPSTLSACYKLYSSPNMVVQGGTSFDPTTDLNAQWNTQPALFTDLNSPVTNSAGTAVFPIVDGNAMQSLSKDFNGATVPPYLGYDATNNTTGAVGADGLPDVEGFSVNAPGSNPYVTYNAASALSPTNTPVPMPVQWLYVLKDGTLTAPTGVDSTGTIANWQTASASQTPSSTNPITGRIAFWTDDETSKVNINTAGQGAYPASSGVPASAYWDTPHFYCYSIPTGNNVAALNGQFPDYAYAAYQPALNEFQRYPGHPAQVSLTPIFSAIAGQNLAGITPRLVWGGSQAGTVWAGQSAAINPSNALRQPLYASLDELLFTAPAPSPPPSAPTSSYTRPINQIPGSLTQAQLEQAKFFLTATSRGPEVNLFEKPRVAIWPISSDLATHPGSLYTTAHDRLIAFCSTLRKDLGANDYPFFFQRGKLSGNPNAPTGSQSPTADYTGIPRNQLLYAYLHGLMGTAVPGFGGNFATKYGVDSDQILTEIFDYIRCTNLSDPTLGGLPPAVTWTSGTYQFANYENTATTNQPYCGQVMPIQIGTTMGFGRYHTVKDVSVNVICTGDGRDGPMPSPTPAAGPTPSIYQQSNDTTTTTSAPTYNPSLAGTALTTTQKRFQIALLLNYFLPSPGQLKCGPDMLVRITGLNPTPASSGYQGSQGFNIAQAINIDGGSLFPAPPTSSGWVEKLMAANYSGYNPVDAVLKFRYGFMLHRSPLYTRPVYVTIPNSSYNYNSQIVYPFVSRAFTLTNGSTIALANPVNLKIELFQAQGAYDNNDLALSSSYKPSGAPTYDLITGHPADNLIQTLYVTIPAGTFPQPTLPISPNIMFLPTSQSPQGAWGFDGRIASVYTVGGQGSAMIENYGTATDDTVRTISVTTGDLRPIAASSQVPATMFSPQGNYSGAPQLIHYFLDNNNLPIGFQSNPMAPGIYLNSYFCPAGTSALNAYGDWDGPDVRAGGLVNDGSFINKPDEGDNITVDPAHGEFGINSYLPYYGFNESTTTNLNLYTPNRLMPSPGMFGSLPTRVQQNIANNAVMPTNPTNGSWQTLLFRPQGGHPNYSTTIPDHLIMDLFWMPIVEPYAISEPFSTAGKINLNYQIAPFTYINRSTAMAALLTNQKIAARPSTMDQAPTTNTSFRLSINPSQNGGTLQQCAQRFAAGDIYHSATQICDLDLVPFADPNGVAQTWSANWGNTFWQANANTGDNLREKPYANIYADLTTKSNTFTVHFRVQALRKVPSTNAAQWNNSVDQIVSENRGSQTVERYVDANDTTLPDFATQPASSCLENYADSNGVVHNAYKFRVVKSKQFTP